MRNTRYSEVPKEYRKSRKNKALEFCGWLLMGLLIDALLLLVVVG